MRGLRLVVIVALVLAGLVWLAWRSGEREPVNELALAEAELGIDLESHRIPAGDVTLHVVAAGPAARLPGVLV